MTVFWTFIRATRLTITILRNKNIGVKNSLNLIKIPHRRAHHWTHCMQFNEAYLKIEVQRNRETEMNCNIILSVCFYSLTSVRASKSLKSRQCKLRHTVLNATICKNQFLKWHLTIVLREIWYVCPPLNLGALICLGLKLKKWSRRICLSSLV